jgi:hypothetical protein
MMFLKSTNTMILAPRINFSYRLNIFRHVFGGLRRHGQGKRGEK